MGMLLVTHNFGVVADLCDRVSVMQAGRVVESGPVRSIFTAPLHVYSTALLGATLGRWFGASETDLDLVFPNLRNFDRDLGFMR